MFLKIHDQELYMLHQIHSNRIREKFNELLVTAKLMGYMSTLNDKFDINQHTIQLRLYIDDFCKFIIKFKVRKLKLVEATRKFDKDILNIEQVEFMYFIPENRIEPYVLSLDIHETDDLLKEMDKVAYYL